jgi:hypothetical protein
MGFVQMFYFVEYFGTLLIIVAIALSKNFLLSAGQEIGKEMVCIEMLISLFCTSFIET